MECSRVSHLACNLVTPYLGREPKARVATLEFDADFLLDMVAIRQEGAAKKVHRMVIG